MIISAIDDSPMPGPDEILDAAVLEFGVGNAELRLATGTRASAEFWITIEPEREPSFTIRALSKAVLSTDGTLTQDARAAALIRSLLPAKFSRVVALTNNADLYVDLTPGITASGVENGLRDISEGGFT